MNRSIKNITKETINAKPQKNFIRQIRHNIKELNRSMQSIEKMIERSRNLCNDHPAIISQSRSKGKIKISNNSSLIMRQKQPNPLLYEENKRKYEQNQQSVCKSYLIAKEIPYIIDNPLLNRTISKEDQQVYHFSPQKSKKPISLSAQSKQLSMNNPQSRNSSMKIKHTRFLSIGNQKSGTKTKNYPVKLNNSSNCIQNSNKIKYVQCKTQYKQDKQGLFDKKCETSIGQTAKRHISIKLFSKLNSKKKESEQFKDILMNKGFKVQRPFSHKIRHIFKSGNQELDSQEAMQAKRNRFIEKISQYKFVQNYLSKNEIWIIYDKLVSENIPELKWPIVIVDEVYKKIQVSQMNQ